ncbi:YggS family pyridoxal phosphate-dependent enzyme [Candidatus Pelagibacter sp.]|nr:YggS family pyridoxal phosphate-dependent enzyme [Candidatus Pelagibacter sp.]
MHDSVKNLTYIKDKIKAVNNSNPTIIAVSKTFGPEKIEPLLDFGHTHFGENKIQESIKKWPELKLKYNNIKLHMVGKLQTNKVRDCVKYFDFIHSLDSKKLAKKICDEQKKINKSLKIFIQVNIGEENQKSGIMKDQLQELIIYCEEIGLQIVGLMCMPPANIDPSEYFKLTDSLNKKFGFKELSMGMSSDYLIACEYSSSFLRIGSDIFGKRS